MCKGRVLRHSPYLMVRAYQQVKGISDETMAKRLKMGVMEYCDCVDGYLDFTVNQGVSVAQMLEMSIEQIFLPTNV